MYLTTDKNLPDFCWVDFLTSWNANPFISEKRFHAHKIVFQDYILLQQGECAEVKEYTNMDDRGQENDILCTN